MAQSKEERRAKDRERNQTPSRKKNNKISQWKRQGIIVEGNDWKWFWEIVIATTHCQKCGKELTVDRQNTHSTRVVDHDHSIKNKPNVKYVCCHACNLNDRIDNTSGESNIGYRKDTNCWEFKKIIHGRRYCKCGFETFEEAVEYKKQFLENLLV